ncbi:MAG: protein translocase subunit SecF [Nocardioides sp.]
MGTFSKLGNDLYSGRKSIDFVGRWKTWLIMSGVIIALAIFGLVNRGLDMGIEFVGGAEYRVSLPSGKVTQDTADEIRLAVAGTEIPNAESPVVTTNGTGAILVQTQPLTGAESAEVVDAIRSATGVGAEEISQTELGASWGQEVAKRSAIGLAAFLVLVVLFIWAYFREWKMSLAAIVALIHDLIITIGIYALSRFEVTPATVTGVLTILGFSLYDTVVVFDKVRENTKGLAQSRMTYAQAANLAVNQTLVRSINTSIVALIPVAAILVVGIAQLGSGSLKDLALALFVGMAAGAYSSIFIATPLLAWMKGREESVKSADKRARARQRHDADRYASVPTFSEGMPMHTDPSGRQESGALRGSGDPVSVKPAPAPPRAPEAMGRGRVLPKPDAPVEQSGAAGRAQPKREPRSKRGKR